jgi:LacI family transcriptional regulator
VVGAESDEGYHVVEVPNEELAAALARELAASHAGDFVIIAGPEGLLTSDDRVRGFQRGLADAGLPPADVLHTGFDRTGGYEAGLELAARIAGSGESSKSRLCIFAVNDVMAIGATAALRSKGLWIPRDAAIAGFDDIETLRDFRPALSTVRLPLEEIGRLAVPGAGPGQSVAASVEVKGEVTLRRSTEPAGE